jgi:hypothetical protein
MGAGLLARNLQAAVNRSTVPPRRNQVKRAWRVRINEAPNGERDRCRLASSFVSLVMLEKINDSLYCECSGQICSLEETDMVLRGSISGYPPTKNISKACPIFTVVCTAFYWGRNPF